MLDVAWVLWIKLCTVTSHPDSEGESLVSARTMGQ